jgi:hypothetical protein
MDLGNIANYDPSYLHHQTILPWLVVIVVPLPFQQQTIEYWIKFEILTSAHGFEILKILVGNGYKK